MATRRAPAAAEPEAPEGGGSTGNGEEEVTKDNVMSWIKEGIGSALGGLFESGKATVSDEEVSQGDGGTQKGKSAEPVTLRQVEEAAASAVREALKAAPAADKEEEKGSSAAPESAPQPVRKLQRWIWGEG